MISKLEPNDVRKRRTRSFLKKRNSSQRPRLSVYKSNMHVYAQVIDDVKGVTLAAASTVEQDLQKILKSTSNIEAASAVGKLVAERAIKSGVSEVVYDRSGYIYHGKIKALADSARAAGLKF